MTRDVQVHIRRLVLPAELAGDRRTLERDVIAAIERQVIGDACVTAPAPAPPATAVRIGESVGRSIRAALSNAARSTP